MTRLALASLLAACAAPVPIEAPAPGVPDPFALICLKQGGDVQAPQGSARTCRLPDGSILTEAA